MALLDLFKKSKDDASLISYVNEVFDKESRDYTRSIIDRIIYRNILYYIGEQWIEFVRTAGIFRKRSFPDFVPTPVANEIKSAVRAAKAMLLNQRMVPKIWPNSNDREDKKAAQLGEALLIWMDASDDASFMDETEKTAIWLALAGVAFQRTFIDIMGGGWFMTKDGLVTTGDVVSEHVPSFNVVLDPVGDKLTSKRFVGIQSLKPKEWVEDTFKIKVRGGGAAPGIVDYQRKLMKLVGQVSPWKGAGLESIMMETSDEDLCIFRELEMKPTKTFPQGRYIAVCENQLCLKVDKMPIPVEEGRFYYTLTDFHSDFVPGRFWSDPMVNDILSSQNTINEIDQSLALNRKGLGRPRVVVAGDMKIKKLNEAGSPILVIQYDPTVNAGKPPQIDHGTPLPEQVLKERAIMKENIQDVSGDPKNVLRGQAPSAQSSGIQVDILRETAERGHYPDVERWHRSLTRVYKKRLLLAKTCFTEQRMIKIAGKGSKIKVMAFVGSDLRNNTDIRLELDSGMAQTKSGQRQLLLDMTKQGIFGPVDQNPELRQELIQRFGMAGFTEQSNIDFDRAEDENAEIALGVFDGIMLTDDQPVPQTDPETGQPMQDPNTGEPAMAVAQNPLDRPVLVDDPLFRFDNHQVHYEVHRRFVLSEEFTDLDPKAQKILIEHTDLHYQMVQLEMQAQQAAVAAENMRAQRAKEGGQQNGGGSQGGQQPPGGGSGA